MDAIVHGQDIAVPLGIGRPVPKEAGRAAFDRVWGMGWPFHAETPPRRVAARRQRRRHRRRRGSGRRGRPPRPPAPAHRPHVGGAPAPAGSRPGAGVPRDARRRRGAARQGRRGRGPWRRRRAPPPRRRRRPSRDPTTRSRAPSRRARTRCSRRRCRAPSPGPARSSPGRRPRRRPSREPRRSLPVSTRRPRTTTGSALERVSSAPTAMVSGAAEEHAAPPETRHPAAGQARADGARGIRGEDQRPDRRGQPELRPLEPEGEVVVDRDEAAHEQGALGVEREQRRVAQARAYAVDDGPRGGWRSTVGSHADAA